MRLFYASRDGQTRKIAEYIAAKLTARGLSASPENLAETPPVIGPDLMVVIAAVRYGYHLKEADDFLAAYCKAGAKAPLILVSVNLTARKPNRKTAQDNPYLKRWIKRHKLSPLHAVAIAGKLDYPRYRWFDRHMIRFIMFLTNGPTDPQAVVEFTAWHEVDALIGQIESALNPSSGIL